MKTIAHIPMQDHHHASGIENLERGQNKDLQFVAWFMGTLFGFGAGVVATLCVLVLIFR